MKQFTGTLLVTLFALASAENFDLPELGQFESLDAFTNDRIINGKDAAVGRFPHQVSLRQSNGGRHFCGGTIINARWILTAAHCSFAPNPLSFVAGTVKLDAGGKRYQIQTVVIHPKYDDEDKWNFRHDIALWRTTENIEFDELVQPAILPTEDTAANTSLTTSGWGRTKFPPPPGDSIPNHLQYLDTTSISVASCKKAYRRHPTVSNGNDFDRLVCVLKRRAGSCHGDSGGPLITKDRVVVGLVSWGYPCAKGLPDAFTRVYSFLDFINETMTAEYEN